MNEHTESRRAPNPIRTSTFAARITGVSPAPSGREQSMREMERPRTESYGELWRRANTRLNRF